MKVFIYYNIIIICVFLTEWASNSGQKYKKRDKQRIIRYRSYSIEDLENYKQEMVTLYIPFRREIVHVLDRQKYIDVYSANETDIMDRRKCYEAGMDIEKILLELKEVRVQDNTHNNPQPNCDMLAGIVHSSA